MSKITYTVEKHEGREGYGIRAKREGEQSRMIREGGEMTGSAAVLEFATEAEAQAYGKTLGATVGGLVKVTYAAVQPDGRGGKWRVQITSGTDKPHLLPEEFATEAEAKAHIVTLSKA